MRGKKKYKQKQKKFKVIFIDLFCILRALHFTSLLIPCSMHNSNDDVTTVSVECVNCSISFRQSPFNSLIYSFECAQTAKRQRKRRRRKSLIKTMQTIFLFFVSFAYRFTRELNTQIQLTAIYPISMISRHAINAQIKRKDVIKNTEHNQSR